jgi:hypothetical protein
MADKLNDSRHLNGTVVISLLLTTLLSSAFNMPSIAAMHVMRRTVLVTLCANSGAAMPGRSQLIDNANQRCEPWPGVIHATLETFLNSNCTPFLSTIGTGL